jgi:hypothetical protein
LSGRSGREPDFAQNAGRGFETGLLGVIQFGLAAVLGLLRGEADLDSVVAVGFSGLDLDDRAGAGFDHGDGHEHVLRIVDLRHSEFFT